MPTQILPAASLSSAQRLPAARALFLEANYLICIALRSIGRAISGVKTRFLPHSRDERWGPRRTGHHLGLLRGDAAIDDETGPGHKAGVVRGEKDDALGDVAHRSHAADRQPGQRLA